jgi:hypothetical protein
LDHATSVVGDVKWCCSKRSARLRVNFPQGKHMNSSTTQPTDATPVDPDLVEQAVPGHGVPSQDPDSAAQVAIDPEEAERESKSVLMGGGVVAGSAAGAAVGAVVAGPVGVLVGGTIGAVAGALGGGAAGELVNPESTPSAEDAPKDDKDTHRTIPPR